MSESRKTDSPTVFLVWTEEGEYEMYSRDLRGIFSTRELAEQHKAIVGRERGVDAEVAEWPVMDAPLSPAKHYNRAGHVLADGTVHRTSTGPWDTWEHECPRVKGRIGPWSSRGPDLYVEVHGYDREAVEVEFRRLLSEARERVLSNA